jgi:DNA mismatch repair protein MutL
MSAPMGGIKRLPEDLINKIAAGEVIERPASVVKELVENSLDAGATRIEVAVEAGGKNFIQVLDNGSGMSPDDAGLALERHATSKLDSLEGLEHVLTMGFRGEALPTIAAVSRFELRTRRKQDAEGLQIWVADGVIQEQAPWTGPAGTRIIARNLFFSTPARRKFLSTNRSEMKHILQVLRRIALANPHVHIQLISDGQELGDWTASDLAGRIAQLFGEERLHQLLEVNLYEGGVRVRGYAGKINTFKRGYGDQYLFVNGRPITSRMINHAIFSAYGHTLQREQVPFYVIFLELDPRVLDVNVHPAKREVRFEDERFIHKVVGGAVRLAMSREPVINLDLNRTDPANDPAPADEARQAFPGGARLFTSTTEASDDLPQRTWSRQERLFSGSAMSHDGPRELLDSARMARERFSPAAESRWPMTSDNARMDYAEEIEPGSEIVAFHELAPLLLADDEGRRPTPILQFQNTYLFAPVQSGMLIIDQHVAHERILYERCLRVLEQQRGNSQRLLFPHALDLDEQDQLVFEEVLDQLLALGFEMEMEEGRPVLTGIPVELSDVHPEDLVPEILAQFRVYAGSLAEPAQALAASVACKAAIKAGQPLKQEEMRRLLADLFACEQPFTCPHGRPVVIQLGLKELHRRFERA